MSPSKPWAVVGALVAVVLCAAVPAAAQPKPSAPAGDDGIATDEPDKPWSAGVPMDRRAAAKALFEDGNRLFRIPLFAKAAERYKAALADWKHPAFYFNLALAQLNLSQEVEARDSLERALAHGKEGLKPEEYKEAQRQLEELARTLGRLRVVCRTPGAEVTLDGATLFTGPGAYEGWVKATPHELTAKKAGYIAEARRLTVSPGQSQEIELELVTLSEATDRSRRWATWKPWAVVATGAVFAAAGGGMHVLSAKTFKEYDDQFEAMQCAQGDPPPGCENSALDLSRLERARRQQVVAVGGYLAGGALIATGIALLYLNRPRLTEMRTPRQPVTVEPAISVDTLGVQVSLSY